MNNSLNKSELIESLAKNQDHLAHKDVELAVKVLLSMMSERLASGDRIEIRGFGSFSLHFRRARVGRNPKSGDEVGLRSKFVPHFKPGKELRERVNLTSGKTSDSVAKPTAIQSTGPALNLFAADQLSGKPWPQ